MAVDQQKMRMLAALLRTPKQSETMNALAQRYANPPPSNWLSKPLPMEGRFNLLPIREEVPGMGPSVFNKRSAALPGVLAAAVNAFTAPGRAMSGPPGFDPKAEGFNFGGTFMGSGLLGSRMAPAPRGSIGMNAYHGSPHKFDAFDISKIGTGEGAQAYGHGLYFAENPGVARSYVTAGDPVRARIDGKDAAIVGGGGIADRGSVGELASWIDSYSSRDSVLERLRSMKRADLLGLHDTLEKAGRLKYTEGNLYHVDIPDEAIGKMLDWDKPLSEQPEALLNALADDYNFSVREIGNGLADVRVSGPGIPDGSVGTYDVGRARQIAADKVSALKQLPITGQSIYNTISGLQNVRNPGPASGSAKASQWLNARGIPGIRYLDQGSRAGGNGTRNFVLFDDKLTKITKRE
jgi:hypothetical protein